MNAEIIKSNGLQLVTTLSDPDNLNQLVVSLLPAEEEHAGSDNLLKKVLAGLFYKFKCFISKPREVHHESSRKTRPRSLKARTTHRSKSDEDDCLKRIQENLAWEMWRVGDWIVNIKHVDWEDKKLIFTVHLEEEESPESLQWDIKKTYTDMKCFCRQFKYSNNLATILELEESEVTDEGKEEVRASVEHFLQKLVSDHEYGRTRDVFLFLFPVKLLNEEEHYGDMPGFLNGLAHLIYQEEEDATNFSVFASSCPPNTIQQPESTAGSLEDHLSSVDKDNHLPTASPQPVADSDSSNENSSQDKTEDSDNPRKKTTKIRECSPRSPKVSYRSGRCRKLKRTKQQLKPTKVICDLLKEISGNSLFIKLIGCCEKIMDKRVYSFLNGVKPAEEVVAEYISKLWPEVPQAPAPPRTEEEKKESRDQARNLISDKYSRFVVLSKRDLESVFDLFQNSEGNKILVYRLLSFLLKEIFPSEQLEVTTAALLKVTNLTAS
ncbi:uncharacterized protein KZ484_009624 isoform 2-T2 [Pholidichthys leucotaenia]